MTSPHSRIIGARVAVVGASGFVGGAVVDALERRGAQAGGIRAPRLAPTQPREVDAALAEAGDVVKALAQRFHGADAVVNAAGNSQAGSGDLPGLLAANAVLPGVIAMAAREAGVPRVVHISSGAVQGDAPVLDSSAHLRPFSAYSYSKALGEQTALGHHDGAILYRPAGVQGEQRAVSRKLVRVARSPLAVIAGDGAGNSPQALIDNVADAVAFLALTRESTPSVVHHPSEGLSVGELLELLGGAPPRRLPEWGARAVIQGLAAAGRVAPSLSARRRRLEVMWFGQEQAPSWLSDAGWRAVTGRDAWRALGHALSRPQ